MRESYKPASKTVSYFRTKKLQDKQKQLSGRSRFEQLSL